MKIYNVLFESNYENEDVQSEISTFTDCTKAVECLEKALADEIAEGEYTEEKLANCLVRDGDEYFCFYYDEMQSNWKFRCTIYETELC